MLLESVVLIPVLVLLFVGGMEIGKVVLSYYTLQKGMRGAARMAGVLRGANFCDPDDVQITAIKNFIVYGPDGNTASPLVRSLTTDQIVITPERADPDNGGIGACECSGPDGCLVSDGGRQPDYVLISIDGGYSFTVRLPFRTPETILLRPHVRVPFAGQ